MSALRCNLVPTISWLVTLSSYVRLRNYIHDSRMGHSKKIQQMFWPFSCRIKVSIFLIWVHGKILCMFSELNRNGRRWYIRYNWFNSFVSNGVGWVKDWEIYQPQFVGCKFQYNITYYEWHLVAWYTKRLKLFCNNVCMGMGCCSAAPEISVFANSSWQALEVIQIKVLLRASRGSVV
jgi:hypothetical protein